MRKKRIQLVVLLLVLVGLSWFAYDLSSKGGKNSSLNNAWSNFAIKDTAAINRIVLTNQDGQKAVLVRKEPTYWTINDKYRAREDAVNLILETAYRIDVKAPVPQSMRDNALRGLTVSYTKVEFYSGNEKWIKTYYVGQPNKDKTGSFMLLETPKDGKAPDPFMMGIPGFAGHLTTRFFTDEQEWRHTGVFNLDPLEIASVKLEDFFSPEMGYEVRALDKNRFEIFDHKGKSIAFDTSAVRAYLVNFRKVHFQNFNKHMLSKQQEDSLRNTSPAIRLSVTTKTGETNGISIYLKKAPPTDSLYSVPDPDTPLSEWDTERAYGIISTGEVVIIQYFVFDFVLWDIRAFRRETPLVTEYYPEAPTP